MAHIRYVREPDFCVEFMKTGAPGNTGVSGKESSESGSSDWDLHSWSALTRTHHLESKKPVLGGWEPLSCGIANSVGRSSV